MPSQPAEPSELSFTAHFSKLTDRRDPDKIAHPLVTILFVTLAAVLCGADSWDDIYLFGRFQFGWLRQLVSMPNGVPSADTIRRVFEALNPREFAEIFAAWLKQISTDEDGRQIAIDGKSLKRALNKARPTVPLHLLHAFGVDQRLLLGIKMVDGAPSEPAGVVELLKLLEIRGAVITADANGCTKAVTKAVCDGGADYVLALKGNRGPLHDQVCAFFAGAESDGLAKLPHSHCAETDDAHGRRERREVWAVNVRHLGEIAPGWTGLRSVVRIDREREIKGKVEIETHYYISSLPANARNLAKYIRNHWSVENELHWVLDVTFRDDQIAVRKGNGAENLALIRRSALNLIRLDTTMPKLSMRQKRKAASWDHSFLLHLLSLGNS